MRAAETAPEPQIAEPHDAVYLDPGDVTMGVMTLEGVVEDGRIRLKDAAVLPEKTKVFVVVPEDSPGVARIWSPRLADPSQVEDFAMEMTESTEPDADAEL